MESGPLSFEETQDGEDSRGDNTGVVEADNGIGRANRTTEFEIRDCRLGGVFAVD